MSTLPELVRAEEMVGRVLDAVRADGPDLSGALDQLSAAIYLTDADGFVTYFNPACIDFAGHVLDESHEVGRLHRPALRHRVLGKLVHVGQNHAASIGQRGTFAGREADGGECIPRALGVHLLGHRHCRDQLAD